LSISRRTALHGIAAATGTIALGAAPARGGNAGPFGAVVRKALAKRWRGIMSIPTSSTQQGEWVSQLDLVFLLDAEFNFTGVWIERFNLDDRDYHAKFEMSGWCWSRGDQVGVTIPRTRLFFADTPPRQITWGPSQAELTFAMDQDRPGRYILHGKAAGDDGAAWKVVLKDLD
jgi:hypothetical protein